MAANNHPDIARMIASNAASSAENAVGYQVSQLVDAGVNTFLNMIFGQSKDEKIKEMNEHTDHLIKIVEQNKLPPQREPMLSPRESVERDIRESNEHITTAMAELEKARQKSKCGVCKDTLSQTIDFVGEKTGEILDVSEKVLALQKLKESGEIPRELTWYDLTKKQKKLVEDAIELYKPQAAPIIDEEENEERQIIVRRATNGTKRQAGRKKVQKAGRRKK
jgi:hypothetical protein